MSRIPNKKRARRRCRLCDVTFERFRKVTEQDEECAISERNNQATVAKKQSLEFSLQREDFFQGGNPHHYVLFGPKNENFNSGRSVLAQKIIFLWFYLQLTLSFPAHADWIRFDRSRAAGFRGGIRRTIWCVQALFPLPPPCPPTREGASLAMAAHHTLGTSPFINYVTQTF